MLPIRRIELMSDKSGEEPMHQEQIALQNVSEVASSQQATSAAKLPWGLKNDTLAPGSMKTITETKIKAFQLGAMNVAKKTMSKRDIEENKRKQEELEAQEVYKDFVASFEDSNKIGKMFVKGSTIQAGVKTVETLPSDRGRVYKPTSKLKELAETFTSFKSTAVKDEPQLQQSTAKLNKTKKQQEKRKTNLEAFKDELKRIQEERDRRHELKRKIKEQEESGRKTRFEPYIPPDQPIDSELSLDDVAQEKYSSDDPNSTNIFLSNLSRTLNEMEIMELFGQFGPLASVKIMYPRSEEERARGSNCGFVAFMNREDASEAIDKLDGREFGGLSIRLSWGKTVTLPLQPIYVKPLATDLYAASSIITGYPFNAQPPPNFPAVIDPVERFTLRNFNKLLANTIIRVTVPTDVKLLCLIHRTVEFVIREGPKFETVLIEREKCNPQFRFLIDNNLPSHIYYRWKLFSILQGDSVYQWKENHFKMFQNGSIWIPPPLPAPDDSAQASYDESFERAKAESSENDDRCSSWKAEQLIEILNPLTTDRDLIADAMVYAIERAHISQDIAEVICSTLISQESSPMQKIACLFLISDILHNCSFGVFNASSYRKAFEEQLPTVFESLYFTATTIDSKVKSEQFRSKVMSCFRAWEDWTVYPSDMLIRLQSIFMGLVSTDKSGEPFNTSLFQSTSFNRNEDEDDKFCASIRSDLVSSVNVDVDTNDDADDIDGQPLDDIEREELEQSSAIKISDVTMEDFDIDGEPLDMSDVDDNAPRFTDRGFFLSSKWETVDSSGPLRNEDSHTRVDNSSTDRNVTLDSISKRINDGTVPTLSLAALETRSELRSRSNSFDSCLSVSRSSSSSIEDRHKPSSLTFSPQPSSSRSQDDSFSASLVGTAKRVHCSLNANNSDDMAGNIEFTSSTNASRSRKTQLRYPIKYQTSGNNDSLQKESSTTRDCNNNEDPKKQNPSSDSIEHVRRSSHSSSCSDYNSKSRSKRTHLRRKDTPIDNHRDRHRQQRYQHGRLSDHSRSGTDYDKTHESTTSVCNRRHSIESGEIPVTYSRHVSSGMSDNQAVRKTGEVLSSYTKKTNPSSSRCDRQLSQLDSRRSRCVSSNEHSRSMSIHADEDEHLKYDKSSTPGKATTQRDCGRLESSANRGKSSDIGVDHSFIQTSDISSEHCTAFEMHERESSKSSKSNPQLKSTIQRDSSKRNTSSVDNQHRLLRKRCPSNRHSSSSGVDKSPSSSIDRRMRQHYQSPSSVKSTSSLRSRIGYSSENINLMWTDMGCYHSNVLDEDADPIINHFCGNDICESKDIRVINSNIVSTAENVIERHTCEDINVYKVTAIQHIE
ncbi:hypothetical protein GJ496_004727 [Pomphorhynchus laevis]|nr:hypothetical protein GJ496_004727 [Pomphorhynchus laevis]